MTLHSMADSDSLIVVGGGDERMLRSAVVTSSDHGKAWRKTLLEWKVYLAPMSFASGKFVALGHPNLVFHSEDGIDWSNSTIPGAGPLNAGIWTGSRFVVIGNGGAIWTSQDGVSWEKQNSGTANNLGGLAWSGRQLVVAPVGQNWVLASPDGIQWTRRKIGLGVSVTAVAWTGTQFVAAGTRGSILISPEEFSQAIRPPDRAAFSGSLFTIREGGGDRLLLSITGVPAGTACSMLILDGSGRRVQAWRGSAEEAVEMAWRSNAPGTYYLLGSAAGKTETRTFGRVR